MDKTTEAILGGIMMVIIYGAPIWIPLVIIYVAHKKNPAVQIMSVEELKSKGFTEKEAIIEQRQQRKEARDHVRTMTNSVRAATKAGHLAKRLTKKI